MLAEPEADLGHRDANGPPNLCGVSAATVPALEAIIRARFGPLPGNERYVLFEDPSQYRVWTFTTAAHAAHPSVSCMTVAMRNGQIGLNREIRCTATRALCDDLAREFRELDKANGRRFRGR